MRNVCNIWKRKEHFVVLGVSFGFVFCGFFCLLGGFFPEDLKTRGGVENPGRKAKNWMVNDYIFLSVLSSIAERALKKLKLAVFLILGRNKVQDRRNKSHWNAFPVVRRKSQMHSFFPLKNRLKIPNQKSILIVQFPSATELLVPLHFPFTYREAAWQDCCAQLLGLIAMALLCFSLTRTCLWLKIELFFLM